MAWATHFGHYSGLGAAHDPVRQWCRANNRQLAGPNWEIYGHWQSEWNANPSRIRTDVYDLLTSYRQRPPRRLWLNSNHLEETMGRKYIDCRAYPSEMSCTIALSADTEAELLDAAVQHAVAVHKHEDTPELRQMLKSVMKDGSPPIESPRPMA
jgi:predicted small metal-binding protein